MYPNMHLAVCGRGGGGVWTGQHVDRRGLWTGGVVVDRKGVQYPPPMVTEAVGMHPTGMHS